MQSSQWPTSRRRWTMLRRSTTKWIPGEMMSDITMSITIIIGFVRAMMMMMTTMRGGGAIRMRRCNRHWKHVRFIYERIMILLLEKKNYIPRKVKFIYTDRITHTFVVKLWSCILVNMFSFLSKVANNDNFN